MIIDTDNLKQAIENHEENILQKRYNGNWETCPMSFLNSSEKRVIDRKNLVTTIESLTAELLGAGDWPTK